jgi:hypothetical protein
MEPTDAVRMRRCARRFIHLADGGVRVVWACGSQKDFPDETAVDVDILADHLPTHHHHHAHLPHHRQPHSQGVTA